VLTIAGDDYKGTAVGVITLTGAVISLVAYPIVGILRFVCCERLQTFFDDRSDACAFSFSPLQRSNPGEEASPISASGPALPLRGRGGAAHGRLHAGLPLS
jgi:hypothetical protein